MTNRILAFLILLLGICGISAQKHELSQLMNTLLKKNPDYQQALSRYEQEKALFSIDNSLDWFDINLSHRQYDNDFTRDETETVLEHSDVEEKDKRWRIEVEKTLFPKDFDNVTNTIGNRINLLRYKQDFKLAYSEATADIFDDMIDWYEAEMMVSFLKSSLDILYQQNQVLEELNLQNQIGPEILIDNLEEIDKLEDDLFDYRETVSVFKRKYGEILPEFLQKNRDFISLNPLPDTLTFQQHIESETNALKKEVKNISGKIKLNYTHFFLPEVTLTLSYNWRENRQNWDIEKNNIFKSMIRNQDEEFPEGEIEISIPFNMFSNTSGKLALLKAYQRELRYRGEDMQLAWQKFGIDRLNFYRAARLELKRKTRLHELYNNNLNLQIRKYREEPTLLGSNPELKLQKDTIKTNEAELEMKLSEMKLYKEVFLINSLVEESK